VREIGEVVATSITGPVDEVAVASVAYIQSDLRPSGAVYTTLFDASLGGG
jgi:2'-5' RNA ligase